MYQIPNVMIIIYFWSLYGTGFKKGKIYQSLARLKDHFYKSQRSQQNLTRPPLQINKHIQNTKTQTPNKIFLVRFQNLHIFLYLWFVRALCMQCKEGNGSWSHPEGWIIGQNRGHRRGESRGGYLSKAKRRKGSEDKGFRWTKEELQKHKEYVSPKGGK